MMFECGDPDDPANHCFAFLLFQILVSGLFNDVINSTLL